MKQLVYISTSRSEVPSLTEVESILSASRRNNARDGLTGLLIVGGRRFLQALEGPEAQLSAAYARIKRDPRHFALVELSRKPITKASFPDWAMGYEAGRGDLAELVYQLTSMIDEPSLQAQLRGFAQLHSKAA
ncbi:MAG: Sensors of blue-light using FAD [uncultured Sphingomonas sp.]|uniref:Sensors of blue-light using FAD n=1 Tax=uncultured Sphingomonas sp. TaxID=158754 RepID=A0A6J4TNM2_9SPHN|nr:BLUF domain-containing protein [uncultured Sphingomonas sp.]CAA9528586.1 MAG: Sensors of blue-light using FAD [uncultured Sphingomonas sp.]